MFMKKNFVFTRIIRYKALALLTGAMLINFAAKAGTDKPVEPSINFVPKQTYAVSYDKLWDAVMDVLEKEKITTLSADKTSGVIQTDYFAEHVRLNLGGFAGLKNSRWKCNLTLRNETDGSIKLNIIAKCESTITGTKENYQWTDVSRENAKAVKKLETWFYEQIEKELNIGNAGDAQREFQQPAVANSEVLTNDSIVQLVKVGLSEEIVVNMIKTQPTRFDVGMGGILALKTNGVSDKIINEMVLRGQGASTTLQARPSSPTKLNDEPKAVVPMQPPIATTNIITDPEVKKLCEALDQDNPGKVKDALKKLSKMPQATEAVPKILPCLTDSKPDVVREACRTLAKIGNQDAVPALLPLLTNERPDIVREACRTLADIGNKDTIPSIEPLLTNPRSDIRNEAYKAIAKLRGGVTH
jgi:hypothetical protein